jgi:hypothetical protein
MRARVVRAVAVGIAVCEIVVVIFVMLLFLTVGEPLALKKNDSKKRIRHTRGRREYSPRWLLRWRLCLHGRPCVLGALPRQHQARLFLARARQRGRRLLEEHWDRTRAHHTSVRHIRPAAAVALANAPSGQHHTEVADGHPEDTGSGFAGLHTAAVAAHCSHRGTAADTRRREVDAGSASFDMQVSTAAGSGENRCGVRAYRWIWRLSGITVVGACCSTSTILWLLRWRATLAVASAAAVGVVLV